MKCFYHNADLDGKCAGAIVNINHPGCEMIGINYGDPFPWEDIQDGETVFMVDFSLPISLMQRLNRLAKLVWIDHHRTAIEEAMKVDVGFLASGGQSLSISLAACELTWNYFSDQPNRMPPAVLYLGRYDVWDHSHPRILQFQYGMRMQPDTGPENVELWRRLFTDGLFVCEIIAAGKIALEYELQQSLAYANAYSFDAVLAKYGLNLICLNRGMCSSKALESVFDPARHDAMCTFVRQKDGRWKVSLYSDKPDVDCGMYAKQFGGGGHKGAAGFICDKLPF